MDHQVAAAAFMGRFPPGGVNAPASVVNTSVSGTAAATATATATTTTTASLPPSTNANALIAASASSSSSNAAASSVSSSVPPSTPAGTLSAAPEMFAQTGDTFPRIPQMFPPLFFGASGNGFIPQPQPQPQSQSQPQSQQPPSHHYHHHPHAPPPPMPGLNYFDMNGMAPNFGNGNMFPTPFDFGMAAAAAAAAGYASLATPRNELFQSSGGNGNNNNNNNTTGNKRKRPFSQMEESLTALFPSLATEGHETEDRDIMASTMMMYSARAGAVAGTTGTAVAASGNGIGIGIEDQTDAFLRMLPGSGKDTIAPVEPISLEVSQPLLLNNCGDDDVEEQQQQQQQQLRSSTMPLTATPGMGTVTATATAAATAMSSIPVSFSTRSAWVPSSLPSRSLERPISLNPASGAISTSTSISTPPEPVLSIPLEVEPSSTKFAPRRQTNSEAVTSVSELSEKIKSVNEEAFISSVVKKWTEEEDELLRRAVERNVSRNWKAIARCVPGRNEQQCVQRWKNVLACTFKKGTWSEEEDQQLAAIIKAHKEKNPNGAQDGWIREASRVLNRTAKQCRERWENAMNPHLCVADFTPEEDEAILSLHAKLGNQWKKIAAYLKGRTGNRVKSRFQSLHKKIKVFHEASAFFAGPSDLSL